MWALTFITLGWYMGPAWEAALATAHRHLLIVAALVAGVAVAVVLWRGWANKRR
jgi:membrane protein DedA with SNARE-associated domain